MLKIICIFLLCIVNSLSQTGSFLKLNEIMFYPLSGNNEFIEIYNTSTTESIDLNQYRIKYYSASADVLTDAGEGTILSSLSYAVIFEGDYDLTYGIYNNLIPEEALVLKITDNSFGSTGMSNTSDRPVWLISPLDDTLDIYTYSADNTQSHSDEKIFFESDSSQVNWSNSAAVNGTPGFINSVTPLAFDLRISSINILPDIPVEGDNILIDVVIMNEGENTASDFSISIFNDINLDSIPQSGEQIYSQDYYNLPPGDSVSAYTSILTAPAGFYNIITRVYFSPDEDTSNNTAYKSFNVYPACTGYNDVVINEIMYAPSAGEPEWIEIYNRTAESVNIKGWMFSDNSTTKVITDQDIILQAGSFIVLTKDSSILNYYSVPCEIIKFSLPALNNTGDAVVVKDSLGIMVDSLAYLPDWGGSTGGRSLERISVNDPGTLQSNWSTSESMFKATPGDINSVTSKENDLKITLFKFLADYGIIGEPAQSEVLVKNTGLNSSSGYSLSLFHDINRDSIPQSSELVSTQYSGLLAPGDSTVLTISIYDFEEGINYYIAKLINSPDDDTTNNIAFTFITGITVNETRCDLIINEFMYDPDSPQPEWIEIFNRSNKPVNLRNYRIADSHDTITVNYDDLIMSPGDYMVVAADSTVLNYFNIPSYLIAKSFPALNNSGDKIILLDSLNRVIDSLEYSTDWGGKDGFSLERIDAEGPSEFSDNWNSCISRYNGTPGYINSVTTKKYDISVEDIIPSPSYPVFGDNVSLKIRIKNPGLTAASYSLKLYEDVDLDSIPDVLLKSLTGLNLQSGDSSVIESGYTINNLIDTHCYYAQAVFSPDMDTSNNHLIESVFPGCPPSAILINEIMYRPSGGEPEWIEFFNNSGDSVHLVNWTINDVITTPTYAGIDTDCIIAPSAYIVLSRDSAIYDYHRFIPSQFIKLNLPVLNNDADGVVLKDSRGQTIDSVFFNYGWGGTDGRSLERISVSALSGLSSNWQSSDDIESSTPGRINSITPKTRDITITKISSDPEFPVPGDDVYVSAIIKNKGSITASDISVEFYCDSDSDNVPDIILSTNTGISVNPGDSVYVISQSPINNLVSGSLTAVRAVYPNDEDTLNNYAERYLEPGFADKVLLINEIMFNPSDGEPEWIEIINNSVDSVNLKNWSVGDLLTVPTRNFITINDFYLQPAHLSVIAKDTSFYSYHSGLTDIFITNFGVLGNTEDGIILYDFRDAVIDSVHYKSWWGGRKGYSLERISLSGSSEDSSNWTTSLSPDKCTPGEVNSVVNIPAGIRNSVVINEIMSDPGIDNCEFLEFYNSSSDSLNIGGWRIEDVKGNSYRLSDISCFINSAEYFVLAADSILFQKYSFTDVNNISVANTSSLGLSNEGELILLKDVRNTVIDSVFYSSTWHNRNINILKDKSLERINPEIDGNYSQNWSTSVCAEGATPGRQNSIFTDNSNREADISVSPNPFSPDNDGFEDFCIINYTLSQAISQVRIKVFDNRGRLVRNIVNNQPSGSQGTVIFNGLGDDGQALRMGIYIIFLEALNAGSGVIEILKTVVVVARRL